jgi:16S rRNA (cytidine1402-2'-O)-methyltransferase
MTPALYIIATPIGNLQDITLRALDTLRGLNCLYAEDTRVTGILLQRHGIKVPMKSYREAAPRPVLERIVEEVIAQLTSGKSVGYVSDAGTPGVSDPGDYLVRRVREAGCMIVPIPGVSALATIMSVAGLGVQRPLFAGFLPRKKGKETLLRKLEEGLVAQTYDGVIFYESPERIVSLCETLLGWNLSLKVCIGRELTKKFEEIMTGPLPEVYEVLKPRTIKGEIVILVTPA